MAELRREVRYHPDTGRLAFCVHGDAGTTQFVISTGWRPDWVEGNPPDGHAWVKPHHRHADLFPSAMDFGHHWDTSTYEGEYQPDHCDLRPRGQCFYDGSSLHAETVFGRLLISGEAAVWQELEDYYHELERGEAES